MKTYHAPSQCPVCGEPMQVTRLHCPNCHTELSGQFTPCRFCTLEEKHLQFVEVFLRCRGSIKEVERTLYPLHEQLSPTANDIPKPLKS